MKVKLLPIDKNEVIDKIYIACRTCYSKGSPILGWEDSDYYTEEEKLKLIKYVLGSGHYSTVEHVQLTFLIEGVSRSLTHQLVRHRHASYSQQSQRYVEFREGKFDYVTPKTIEKNEKAKALFDSTMGHISSMYDNLAKLGIPAEDARAVLPNACCSNITVSMNLRELIHICNERLCTCAQDEIRTLVREMVKEVVEQLSFLKDYLVPKCEMLGYCNEPRRSCGRKKLKSEVIG